MVSKKDGIFYNVEKREQQELACIKHQPCVCFVTHFTSVIIIEVDTTVPFYSKENSLRGESSALLVAELHSFLSQREPIPTSQEDTGRSKPVRGRTVL